MIYRKDGIIKILRHEINAQYWSSVSSLYVDRWVPYNTQYGVFYDYTRRPVQVQD
jgi:hypothetical protein